MITCGFVSSTEENLFWAQMRWWEAISDSGYYRRYHLKTINTFPEILSGYSLSINHPRLLRDPPARTHKLYRLGTESNFLGQFPKGSLEQIIPGARKYLFWCGVHLSPGLTISHPSLCHLLAAVVTKLQARALSIHPRQRGRGTVGPPRDLWDC